MAFTRMGNVNLTREQFANRVVWVKALVSGDYKQGKRRLRRSDGTYCCLGVAADCLGMKSNEPHDFSQALLPGVWADENLGFDPDNPFSSHEQLVATRWNDTRELNFDQIADRIALATDKSVSFQSIEFNTPELDGEEPGVYAREWLKRLV